MGYLLVIETPTPEDAMNAITPTVATAPAGLPRMNEPAPDFTALTTHGMKSLAD